MGAFSVVVVVFPTVAIVFDVTFSAVGLLVEEDFLVEVIFTAVDVFLLVEVALSLFFEDVVTSGFSDGVVASVSKEVSASAGVELFSSSALLTVTVVVVLSAEDAEVVTEVTSVCLAELLSAVSAEFPQPASRQAESAAPNRIEENFLKFIKLFLSYVIGYRNYITFRHKIQCPFMLNL